MTIPPTFTWPGGKRAALSITFDDADPSQVDLGLPILNEHRIRGSFYVSFRNLYKRTEAWKQAAAEGHEIGNHTTTHPCSGNFAFARRWPLELMTLEQMERDIDDASATIREVLGITPATFAYPCGQKFVGRGEAVRSYVPLVAGRFVAGRSFNDETANHPAWCDLSQLAGMGFDRVGFEAVRPHIDAALRDGVWLILVGHIIGARPPALTVLTDTLRAVCEYARGRDADLHIGTVHEIATHLAEARSAGGVMGA
jgi:peptidoglycan/xylan/chitin deacetylase (PgdA/CDA1 family)